MTASSTANFGAANFDPAAKPRNRFSPLADRLQSDASKQVIASEQGAVATGTHSMLIGYATWLLGMFGAHRFYYGKPISGTLYFFTFGLLFVGWIVDLFLIPGMQKDAHRRYVAGEVDYNVAWLLLTFLGVFGVHRLYMGKWITGAAMLLVSAGTVIFFPLGLVVVGIMLWDFLTLNEQITEINLRHA